MLNSNINLKFYFKYNNFSDVFFDRMRTKKKYKFYRQKVN